MIELAGDNTKGVSAPSAHDSLSSEMWMEEEDAPIIDMLTVKVKSLRLTTKDTRRYGIKISFMDSVLLNTTIKPIWSRDVVEEFTIAQGKMTFDPSSFENMSVFADHPVVVRVQPVKTANSVISDSPEPAALSSDTDSTDTPEPEPRKTPVTPPVSDITCCNIDILGLFIDVDKMEVRKRLQPIIEPPPLHVKSWDNHPLLSLEFEVKRHRIHTEHHKELRKANIIKMTIVAAYNIIQPFDRNYMYFAATKAPMENIEEGLQKFNFGYQYPPRFRGNSFYPTWESLRSAEDLFIKGDEKLAYTLKELKNYDNINLEDYLRRVKMSTTVVWGSFHRVIMSMEDAKLVDHLRHYRWPLEFHIAGKDGTGYSFMGFMKLNHLLYPGETKVKVAVPLYWANSIDMAANCGCDLLISPNYRDAAQPVKKPVEALAATSVTTAVGELPTGYDGKSAFVVVEIQVARSLLKPSIPPVLSESEINQMLMHIEAEYCKPWCTGRGQQKEEWQATVRTAANALRRLPYYGVTEFCAFNRQLSETRTRVELSTSCWQEAALYVNNTFVVQDYMGSEEKFEEMLMMAHACLVRDACETLVGIEPVDLDPMLRAARHARHLQDTQHALTLYLQVVTQNKNNANSWRELSTCMRDVDSDLADVCLDKAVYLDPRHPLTLLAKGSMLFEEDSDAAELFFTALMSIYPFWTTGWVASVAFYIHRQEYHVADQIIQCLLKTQADGLAVDLAAPRAWETELGDWWDHTPLMADASRYYDAADLLLRLRAMPLAEVCLGRSLVMAGESAAYAHLVALSCRLRGDVDNALCRLQGALQYFGEISYLRSLEAECYHKQNNREESLNSHEKSGHNPGPYSTLIGLPCRDPQRTRNVLVDLLRREPSAYAWMALADDWLRRQAEEKLANNECGDGHEVPMSTCAAACAIQAIKWDRRYAVAWALLARLVKPRTRRRYCRDMAAACGYKWSKEQLRLIETSQHSLCYRMGDALQLCLCEQCTDETELEPGWARPTPGKVTYDLD